MRERWDWGPDLRYASRAATDVLATRGSGHKAPAIVDERRCRRTDAYIARALNAFRSTVGRVLARAGPVVVDRPGASRADRPRRTCHAGRPAANRYQKARGASSKSAIASQATRVTRSLHRLEHHRATPPDRQCLSDPLQKLRETSSAEHQTTQRDRPDLCRSRLIDGRVVHDAANCAGVRGHCAADRHRHDLFGVFVVMMIA